MNSNDKAKLKLWEEQRAKQYSRQNDFIQASYDRINLTVPKGHKAEIKARADELGLSVNSYINSLIDEDIQAAK